MIVKWKIKREKHTREKEEKKNEIIKSKERADKETES